MFSVSVNTKLLSLLKSLYWKLLEASFFLFLFFFPSLYQHGQLSNNDAILFIGSIARTIAASAFGYLKSESWNGLTSVMFCENRDLGDEHRA